MDYNHQIIDAYGDYILDYRRKGWKAYFISFMFNHLRGSRDGLLRQMEKEVERVYATFLTRIIRDPTHKRNVEQDLLPRWIICPDWPVPKRVKMSLQEVTINNGLHLQGFGLIPPTSRLRTGLDEHFEEYQPLYVRSEGALQRVPATPITRTPKKVVGYGFKSIPRYRASFDDLIILPKALSEVKDQQGRE